jgi:hypothetical protein
MSRWLEMKQGIGHRKLIAEVMKRKTKTTVVDRCRGVSGHRLQGLQDHIIHHINMSGFNSRVWLLLYRY